MKSKSINYPNTARPRAEPQETHSSIVESINVGTPLPASSKVYVSLQVRRCIDCLAVSLFRKTHAGHVGSVGCSCSVDSEWHWSF